MASKGGGGGGDPWAWLGLLKWSLSYSDGTKETDLTPMTAEDRIFLEAVMKEGIIDENERLKTILKQITGMIDKWKLQDEKSCTVTQDEEDETQTLLQELRDIVEQIDYARAFAAMKGLNFLLGCVQERTFLPRSMRLMCLGIIATMCQHNPPVQKELLELGALGILSDLYFIEHEHCAETDSTGQLRARIIQAVSANVRSHDMAESVFEQLEQAPRLVALGLGFGIGQDDKAPAVLCQRTLFFLKALVTSDSSSRARIQRFIVSLAFVVDYMLDDKDSAEIREMAVGTVQQVLEQKKGVNLMIDRKTFLASLGVQRVCALRSLTGEDREYAAVELELWEKVLILLARATPDEETTGTTEESTGSDAPKSLTQ